MFVILQLTYLLTAYLLNFSPAADLAETHTPHYIPPPPNSGRGALRLAAPHAPLLEEDVSHSHLRPRPVDHLELKRLKLQIPDLRIDIFHAVDPLAGVRGPDRE